jgi:multiple sugar transport system substrate-binding protein
MSRTTKRVMRLSGQHRRLTGAGAIAGVLAIAIGGGLLLTQTGRGPGASASPSPNGSPAQTSVARIEPLIGPPSTDWFVGRPERLPAESDFANRYNDTNPNGIFLKPEWVKPGGNPTDTLSSLIGAGRYPDLFGPVGIQVRAELEQHVLGLNDEIETSKTDLSAYPSALLNTFKNSAGQYESLPYLEYPAFIFYNKDLFKAAGLPDLPTRVGQKYMGRDWTWDELATVAKQLTVDTSGKRSTDPGFNPASIEDYGFDTQSVNDLRRFATTFGAGSYVAADGKTAQIPTVWEQAAKWYYDAMWTWHFAPTAPDAAVTDGGAGTSLVATGRVAMDLAWAWEIPSFGVGDTGNQPASKSRHWDMGVLPSNNGVTTVPVDTDTFVIEKSTRYPDRAYKAMVAIMSDPTLMAAYGGLPADPSRQATYFETTQAGVDKQFADNPITWPVLTEMAKYAASPTHQDAMPNYAKATADDQAFYAKLQSQSGLDLDNEIANFKASLQADFDASSGS